MSFLEKLHSAFSPSKSEPPACNVTHHQPCDSLPTPKVADQSDSCSVRTDSPVSLKRSLKRRAPTPPVLLAHEVESNSLATQKEPLDGSTCHSEDMTAPSRKFTGIASHPVIVQPSAQASSSVGVERNIRLIDDDPDVPQTDQEHKPLPPATSPADPNSPLYLTPYLGEGLRHASPLPNVYTNVVPLGQVGHAEYCGPFVGADSQYICCPGYVQHRLDLLGRGRFPPQGGVDYDAGEAVSRDLRTGRSGRARDGRGRWEGDPGQEGPHARDETTDSSFPGTDKGAGSERRVTSRAPTLGELSEEDEPRSEVMDYAQWEKLVSSQGVRACKLQRTDSVTTVAHIYEDLVVSKRLGIRVTLTNLGVVVLGIACFMPNSAAILYILFRLVFGTLFPAYYSYKAIRTKSVKDYVKWMMYWIVFAFFTCVETVTDIFVSFWFPFYYELKILIVLWLLSPATRGSSILYRKFVHPWLTSRESEIDKYIATAKHEGWSAVVELGQKGVSYTTNILMKTAMKGGGDLVRQLRRSYSTGELCDGGDLNSNVKPLANYPDDESCNLSSGSNDSESSMKREAEHPYRTRGSSMSRTSREAKARSADVSDVYFHDALDDASNRKRMVRSQEGGSTLGIATAGTTTARRTRSAEMASGYATLPRTTTRKQAVKKKQG